jgi:VWFA-related protein
VQVVVIVRDRNGQPVSNLKRSDFEIRDNGKVQSISSFTVQGAAQPEPIPSSTPAPTAAAAAPTNASPLVERQFVALFFDDVHNVPGDFARVQKAAEQFVKESLRPEDRVAIFKTSENGEVTFTNDKPKLLAAIDALRVHAAKNTSSLTQCPRISDYEAHLIVNDHDPEALNIVAWRLRDCICPPPAKDCPGIDGFIGMVEGYAETVWQIQKNATQDLLTALDLAVRVLGTMPGRKMLVLSSSGFLSGNLERDVNRVIDNALHGGVVINALNAKGLYTPAPGGNFTEQNLRPEASRYEARQFLAENEAMTDFAESTGGKVFKNNNDFLRGFNELAAPEVAYVLAFSPHALKHDGTFHNLKVEVKTAGSFNVSSRKGYFAPASETRTARAGADPTLPDRAPATRISEPPESKVPATVPGDAPVVAPTEPRKTGAQPEDEAEIGASNATPPSLQPDAAGVGPSASPVEAKPPSAVAAAEVASEQALLNRASREVEHYIEAFADLTADETRSMQSFDEHGFAEKLRSMQSALVIYRLRNDPKRVIESREVIAIDGHEVKGHAARATKLWSQVAEARSPQQEIGRIKADSERYDIGLEGTGLTLFEGLPLRARCAGDFTFRDVRHEIANGRPVRVFAYQQVRPCDVISYHFDLPPQFAGFPLVHAGELKLDAETGQVLREERNVYVGSPGKKPPRAAHIVLAYGESPLGILVPKTIEVETFVPRLSVSMTYGPFLPYARTVESYGPFSRFEVSVGEKVSAPAR